MGGLRFFNSGRKIVRSEEERGNEKDSIVIPKPEKAEEL